MVAGCGSAWHRHPHLTQWAAHSNLGFTSNNDEVSAWSNQTLRLVVAMPSSSSVSLFLISSLVNSGWRFPLLVSLSSSYKTEDYDLAQIGVIWVKHVWFGTSTWDQFYWQAPAHWRVSPPTKCQPPNPFLQKVSQENMKFVWSIIYFTLFYNQSIFITLYLEQCTFVLTIVGRPLHIDCVCQDWRKLAQWGDVDWPEREQSCNISNNSEGMYWPDLTWAASLAPHLVCWLELGLAVGTSCHLSGRRLRVGIRPPARRRGQADRTEAGPATESE